MSLRCSLWLIVLLCLVCSIPSRGRKEGGASKVNWDAEDALTHSGEEFDDVDVGEVDFEGKVDRMEFAGSFDDALKAALEEQDLAWDVFSESGLQEELVTESDLKDFLDDLQDVHSVSVGVVSLFELTDKNEKDVEQELKERKVAEKIDALTAWFAVVGLSEKMAKFGVRFAFSTSPTLTKGHAVHKWKVSVFRPSRLVDANAGEEIEKVFPKSGQEDEKWSETELADFILQHAVAPIGQITYENEDLYDVLNRPVICVYADLHEMEPDAFDALVAVVRNLRHQFQKRVGRTEARRFLFAVVEKELESDSLRFFSSDLLFTRRERAKGKGMLLAVRQARGEYFKMDGQLSDLATSTDFLESIVRGNVRAVKLEGQDLQAAQGIQEEKEEL